MTGLCTNRKWLIGIPVVYTVVAGFLVNLLTGEVQKDGATNWLSIPTNPIAWSIAILTLLFAWHQWIVDTKREQLKKRADETETLLIVLQRAVPSMAEHLTQQIESGNMSAAVDAAEAFKKIREHLL